MARSLFLSVLFFVSLQRPIKRHGPQSVFVRLVFCQMSALIIPFSDMDPSLFLSSVNPQHQFAFLSVLISVSP